MPEYQSDIPVLAITGYFQWVISYFGVWCPVVLSYLSFQVESRGHECLSGLPVPVFKRETLAISVESWPGHEALHVDLQAR